MKHTLNYIIISTYIIITFSINITAKPAQKSVSNWEQKWEKKYKSHKETLNNPEKLSSYFINAIKKNGSIQPLLKQLGLNKPFLFGSSSSSYQVEGGIGEENSWTRFAKRDDIKKTPVGNAINFWNQYDEDAQLLGKYNFGLNTIRISIEWSRIQPTQDTWNLNALAHYKKIIKALKDNDLEPIVVLHHYTIPTWFEDIGGFEKQENIHHFVSFAEKTYEALHEDVTLWSTFNAIEGYAFKGYYTQDGPPAQTKDMQLTQQVMAHMLHSHVLIYQALKKRYHELNISNLCIPKPQIGIQKNIIPLDPHPRNTWNPLSYFGVFMGTRAQNQGYYSFFTTGKFTVWIPTKTNLKYPKSTKHYIEQAPFSLDWIGINHYSNGLMQGTKKIVETDPKRKTDNPQYRFYPEGLYRATQHIHNKLVVPLEKKTGKKIPIIITENGLAVGENEKRREEFFKKALFTIATAIKDGYNVIGYTPWSHADNYEWGSPYGTKRYGLLYVDFDDPKLPRSIKKGAEFYKNFVHAFFKWWKQH